ncbi:glycosyltransferase family 2 protein [Mucilaginibacter sp. Mucisp84]|uniref:glycosyltransferase family 2 protein n=1 Tax=Mucilaginibacter sp. Mucisp84 TaxID=3243058 RepID=UPI0039A4ECC7
MNNIIKPPSKRQLFYLRLMIIIGLLCMFFLIHSLLRKSVIGYQPLYWLLISTFVYTFFKVIYEWYHYWSISVPPVLPITKQYTVDIFTTFCAGEPYEMIVETLTAIQAIRYPHETFLCDEADDPYLKSVCKELGVHHITRTKKINAKAGNINNALAQSSGELCVILDPDHIPVPEFLDPIIAHFDNPEIGYVQIVQAYYNHDIGWIAKGAAQQTYQFYGPMMMCMNSYGTVQAIGANCTFRRTALESIGGHAAGLAEDMHTAMQLHARNWKSVYVPAVLTRGLVPATLSAYYKQQLKWSRGVFELLVTSYVKLFRKFNWRQKLHYGLLPLFYLSGFVFLINFSIPVISLFTDAFPLRMDFSEFLVISVPFITSVVLIRHFVQQWVMEDNERGFHVVGGLLLIGTWWVFILGFVYTVIRKNVPYIATPKDIKDEKNLKNNLPNIIVLVVSIAAIIYGLYNDWNPYTLFMSGIVGLNCMFMVFMLIASSELKFQAYLDKHATLFTVVSKIQHVKIFFWLLRRKIYFGVRKVSLILSILVVGICIYASQESDEDASFNVARGFDAKNDNSKKSFTEFISSSDTTGLSQLIRQSRLYNSTSRKFSDTSKNIIEQDPVTGQKRLSVNLPFFSSVKGVIYSKGNYWYKNIAPLTKKMIVNDFEDIRKAGINTIKIYGPNIYDHSIFEAAAQKGLKINYSFWVPAPSSFINDTTYLHEQFNIILNTINKNKSNPNISAWNLGNSTYQQLSQFYHGPQLYRAQQHYINLLKRLVNEIKHEDPTRPLTIDLLSSPTLNPAMQILKGQIPAIDAFGVIVDNKRSLKYVSRDFKTPYFFSCTDPGALEGVQHSGGIFYTNWQDQQSGTAVTFDGLKDVWGRNKRYLYKISRNWNGNTPVYNLPDVKILKPALTTTPGASLRYNALVFSYGHWNIAAYLKTGLNFEWYLVKTDNLGNATGMKKVGSSPDVYVTIPKNDDRYRLYLVATDGDNVTVDYATLNTPLQN